MSRGAGRNAAFGALLAGVVAAMVGASFAAVPLYRMFCAVTGYAGTPVVGGASAPGAVVQAGRAVPTISVRMNADTNPRLPWDFHPEQGQVQLKLGDEAIAFYHARNLATEPVTGIALYNVTPEKVGKYFHKTACFCFNRQTLNPGQEMQFPVTFWVDPAIATDPNTSDVRVITLSYTFFRSLEDAAELGMLAKAGPHLGAYTDSKAAPSIHR